MVKSNHDLRNTKVVKKKTRDKSINTDFFFRPNEINSFTAYHSCNEDHESDTEITTPVQDALDTSYIPSGELYESNTSVTTKSDQSDNNKDEKLERQGVKYARD